MGYGMRTRASYRSKPGGRGRPKYGARAGYKRLRSKSSASTRPTKRGRTLSKTKYKKKEQTVRAPPFGGISHSYGSLVNKRRYKVAIKDLSQPYTKTDTSQGEINTADLLGLQGVGYAIQNMEPSFTPNHISILMNEAAQYTIASNGSTSTAYPGYTNQARGFKVILDSSITKTMIGNMTSVGCIFDVYDVVAKRDINQVNGDNGPIATWERGLLQQQAANTVPGDFVNAQSQVGMVGAVPTASKAFNYLWRIAKRTRVELGPGQTHEHVFVHKPNRLLDTDRLYIQGESGTGNSVYQALGGLTHRILIVARGVVVETNNDSGSFSTAHIKLGLVTSRTTRVRPVLSRPRMTAFGDGIPQVSAATQRYYNPGSGAIDTGINDS